MISMFKWHLSAALIAQRQPGYIRLVDVSFNAVIHEGCNHPGLDNQLGIQMSLKYFSHGKESVLLGKD